MSDNQTDVTQVTTKKFMEVPLNLIDDPTRPMRSDISRESLQPLVVSIKQVGLIEPIIVKEVGERYEVIAGHRRTMASEYAKLATVPCHVVQATEDQAEMMKIHENLYREDISPADEARHYAWLIEKKKLTPTKVAQLISRNPKYVTDRLDILNYHPALREALEQGQISFSVAKEFHRIDDESKLKQYLSYAVRGGMTTGVAKKWVDDLQRPEVEAPKYSGPNLDESNNATPEVATSKCFYCTESVNVLEAQVVYVHDHCVTERNNLENQPEET